MSGNSTSPVSPQTAFNSRIDRNGGQSQELSSPQKEKGSKLYTSTHCCHHMHQQCCCSVSHVLSKEAKSHLLFKKDDDGPELMDADVSAIVSALAKQQSEVEDEETEETHSQESENAYYGRKRGGGKIGKRLKKDRKGRDNDSTSSEDGTTLGCPRYDISKDLHALSNLFIQTTMLPRPKSDHNFSRQHEDDGDTRKNNEDIEGKNKDSDIQSGYDPFRKRENEDKHERERHHQGLPLSIPFHPLKTLQKSFHKSDTLYPPTYASVAYASCQTPPNSGILAPSSTPKAPSSPAQQATVQHHSQTPSTFLKISSGKSSNSREGLTPKTGRRSSKSSPAPKYKTKSGKNNPLSDSSLTAPLIDTRARSPSHGTIPQIVAPTPPGGLPIFVTPVPSFDESGSEVSQMVQTCEKRTKYAKSRPKSSGAM